MNFSDRANENRTGAWQCGHEKERIPMPKKYRPTGMRLLQIGQFPPVAKPISCSNGLTATNGSRSEIRDPSYEFRV